MNPSLMNISSLIKTYDSFQLGAIDLDIPKGCILGLVGQNGAGKSTLIKSIFQLIPITSGQILMDGKPIQEYGKTYKELVSYVSEEQSFYGEMSIDWHIQFASRFYSNWDSQMAKTLKNSFHLDGRKKIKYLSKGMRIKLALLIGLCHEAKLLLMDEPTSGLDPVVRTELLQIMQEIMLKEDTSILFSSHISSDIEQISDYVAFLHNGNLVCFEDKDVLLSEWKRFKFDKSIYVKAFDDHIIGKLEDTFSCSAITKDPFSLKRLFEHYHQKAQLVIDNPSIDDILLHIIKGGQYV